MSDKQNERTAELYSYSFDEEHFYGEYPTREAAIEEAFADETEATYVFTGLCVTPIPEDHIYADDTIERIQCQEDFGNDWDDGWPHSSKEQNDELTAALRKTFAEWLDRHNLRPRFFTVQDVQKHTRAL